MDLELREVFGVRGGDLDERSGKGVKSEKGGGRVD